MDELTRLYPTWRKMSKLEQGQWLGLAGITKLALVNVR